MQFSEVPASLEHPVINNRWGLRVLTRASRFFRIYGQLLSVTILILSCGSQRPTLRTVGAHRVDVRVTLAEDFQSMSVQICGLGQRLMRPIHPEGLSTLSAVRQGVRDGQNIRPVRDCVDLAMQLPVGRFSMSSAIVDDEWLVAPTSAWLWLPNECNAGEEIHFDFALPEGVQVTQWPARRFRCEDSRFISYVAFGRMQSSAVPAPSGCVAVSMASSILAGPDYQVSVLNDWIARSALAASTLDGALPLFRVPVNVLPLRVGAGNPVIFGIAGRGPHPTISVYVNAFAGADALAGDWTLVHEFAHLLTPHVRSAQAWFTEGAATYLQEVLRARSGWLTQEIAWRNLREGFERGHDHSHGLSLESNSRQMAELGNYPYVYWSGAAAMFVADVELRKMGSSLDRALARLRPYRNELMDVQEIIARMDEPDGIVAAVFQRALRSRDGLDVERTFAELGVASDGTLFRAPRNRIRDAIMARRTVSPNAHCD